MVEPSIRYQLWDFLTLKLQGQVLGGVRKSYYGHYSRNARVMASAEARF